MKTHDLFDFMEQITNEMEAEYLRIQKRATEDPGTAGDQGEENWAELLRGWLPSNYTVVTKGRLISHDGITTPQIDIIVLHSSYPKRLRDKKVYLAGGVIAAFECKNTLKSSHIPKIVKTAKAIKEACIDRKGSPYRELQAPIIYGLLAHSHSWKSPSSKPIDKVSGQFLQHEKIEISHPKELIDLICIADLATWSRFRTIVIGSSLYGEKIEGVLAYGAAFTSLICHSKKDKTENDKPFSPIGSFIGSMFEKIANEDMQAANMARYYSAVGIQGTGGGNIRPWDESVFKEETKKKLLEGNLTFGRPTTEWSNVIC